MGLFAIIQMEVLANLACIPPIDDLNPFLSSQAVHVYLVWVPAAMPLLFGSAILEVELHLHLIYPLVTKTEIFDSEHIGLFVLPTASSSCATWLNLFISHPSLQIALHCHFANK